MGKREDGGGRARGSERERESERLTAGHHCYYYYGTPIHSVLNRQTDYIRYSIQSSYI